jgi:transcriptional regulator with XRE-family HTH domain
MQTIADELKLIRLQMKFSMETMAEDLGIKSKSTYQGYESGRRKCPQRIIEAARISLEKDKQFWNGLPKSIDDNVKKQFPNGLISEVSE